MLLGVLSSGTCRRVEQQGVSCFQTHILQKQFFIFFSQIFCSSAYRTVSSSSPPYEFIDQILSLFHVKFTLSSLTRLAEVFLPSLIHLVPWYLVHLVPWSLCFYGSFEDDSSLIPQTASASKQIYNFYFPLQCVCSVHLITANLSLFIFISFQNYSCTFIFSFFPFSSLGIQQATFFMHGKACYFSTAFWKWTIW